MGLSEASTLSPDKGVHAPFLSSEGQPAAGAQRPGPDLCGSGSGHEQLSAFGRATDGRWLPSDRRVLAHRSPGRGVVADRTPERGRYCAHARGASGVPRQDGRAGGDPGPHHRDRGLPLGRQRAGLRRHGSRTARHRPRNRRSRDRGASRRGRRRRSRRQGRPVDGHVRHRRRIVGDHLARLRRAGAAPRGRG